MSATALTADVVGKLEALDDDAIVDQLSNTDALAALGLREVVVGGGSSAQPELSFLVEASGPRRILEIAQRQLDLAQRGLPADARIRIHRVKLELATVSVIAEDADVSRQTVQGWTHDKSFPLPCVTLPTSGGGMRAWARQAVVDWLKSTAVRNIDDSGVRHLLEHEVEYLNFVLISGERRIDVEPAHVSPDAYTVVFSRELRTDTPFGHLAVFDEVAFAPVQPGLAQHSGVIKHFGRTPTTDSEPTTLAWFDRATTPL